MIKMTIEIVLNMTQPSVASTEPSGRENAKKNVRALKRGRTRESAIEGVKTKAWIPL